MHGRFFSEKIIKEIQRYYSGRYLWIPKQDYKERNEKSCVLYERGNKVRERSLPPQLIMKITFCLSIAIQLSILRAGL